MDDFSRRSASVEVASVNLYQAQADLDAIDVVEQRIIALADAILRGIRIMFNDSGFKEVVLECRQLETIVLINLVIAILNCLAIFTKVVVERLPIGHNLLQARIFLDDAVVEPIRIGTHGIDPGYRTLEHAIRVKHATRSGLGTLWCNGIDSRRYIAVVLEVIVRPIDGLPGAVECNCPILVIGLSIGISKPAISEGPLSIQGHIRDRHDRCLIRVARTGAVCLGVPARELVTLSAKRTFRKFRRNARREALGIHRASAPVGIKRHCIRVEGRLVELGDESHVRGDRGALIDARFPAGERVGEVLVVCLGGRLTRVHRRFAIFHFIGLVDGALEALPGHRVGVHLRGERRRVGRITGDSGYLRSPAFELIAVLSIAGLGRRIAAIDGDRSVGDLLGLEGGVTVLPGDRVGVDGLVVRGRVCDVARNLVNRRSPTLEGVGVLGISRLRRRRARVGRSRSIGDTFVGLEQCPVLVHPLHAVGVDALRIGCGVRRVTGHGNDVGLAAVLGDRLPSSKRIRVLGVPRLGGLITLVGRNGAVLHLVRLEHRAVGVLPRDGVLVRSLRVGGLVRHVRVCGRNLGRPAAEGVAVLSVSLLCGNRARVRGGLARLHGISSEDSPVIVDPGDLVGFLADLPRSVRIIELGARLGTGGFGIGRIRIL